MHSKMVKFINAITSHDARENDATQTSEVSKYKIINIQPKLDKFKLQCYSKCLKWRRSDIVLDLTWLENSMIIVAESETHVYMKASSATRQLGARMLGAHRIKMKKLKIILRRVISKDLSCK